jgi:RNA polymerase sigma-70 factor, ECF subfamily
MSLENEHGVIERAKQGDAAALRTLVDAYAPVVFRFAFNVCRNQDKAENTTQETFVSVLSKLDQFDHRSKFSTWLYSIVSNHCFMLARAMRPGRVVSMEDEESGLSEEDLGVSDDNPHETVERGDLRKHLDEAIQSLAPEYRVVFILRDIEGLTTEETGEILGLSVPAVKSRLHRARATLRQRLAPIVADTRDNET